MTNNHDMTTIKEEAELHRNHIEEVRLLRLAAERIAERDARFKAEAEFSHLQIRIARQRRALAKLYQRRNDKNTRLSGFLTGMTAALATARKDALEEAAQEMDCACPQRGAVLAKLAKDGPLSHHWPCEKSDDCCALRGAAIRALAKGEGDD